MADDTQDLLAQAQAIQQQKVGITKDSSDDTTDLLKHAQAIQASKSVQPLTNADQNWNVAQSFGQGALQGGTAGFSDELGGLEGALQEKVLPGGNPDKKSLKDLYTEYRDFQRKRNEEAKSAHPVANMAGNITGGVAGAVLSPEALGLNSVAGASALGAATGLGTSTADLTDPTLQNVAGAAKDTAIGGTLGAVAGKVGQMIGGKLPNAEDLEVAGSKLASKAVGLKPSKELSRVYDPTTGQVTQNSNTIRGIGKTAMDEGALPMTGGPSNIYDKSIDAIQTKYDQLNPLIQQTQQKLNANMESALDEAGHIGDKTADYLYKFRDSLGSSPDQDQIMNNIEKKYIPYIEKMTQADGNLTQLNAFKQALQEKATDLNKAAYEQPASDLKPEAEFVKNLGGIVRQHIEDLANAADPQAGDQIAQINKTLGNLYTYRDSARKLMDKGSSSLGIKDAGVAGAGFLAGGPMGAVLSTAGKVALEKSTGNSLPRLAQIASAKVLNQTSKAIETPAGQLAQKAVSNIPAGTINNPFTQGQIQDRANPSESTQLSTNLYNATDDSLKQVAKTMRQTPGLQFYADHLDKAIDTNDDGEKKRAIFVMLQNPRARELVTPTKQLEEQKVKQLNQTLRR